MAVLATKESHRRSVSRDSSLMQGTNAIRKLDRQNSSRPRPAPAFTPKRSFYFRFLSVSAFVCISLSLYLCLSFSLSQRLVAKTVPGRLPQMCAMVIEEAGEGRLAAGGQELLALAEGLSCLGRQPLPPSEVRTRRVFFLRYSSRAIIV